MSTALPLAIIVAIWFGCFYGEQSCFEMRAVGQNESAAPAVSTPARFHSRWAGRGRGARQCRKIQVGFLAWYGFIIAVALLGRNRPAGVVGRTFFGACNAQTGFGDWST